MTDIRKIALELYKPPFRYVRGYIYDSDDLMVADDGDGEASIPAAVISRIRGWGRISYLKDAHQIQDEVGIIVAEALNKYYESLGK